MNVVIKFFAVVSFLLLQLWHNSFADTAFQLQGFTATTGNIPEQLSMLNMSNNVNLIWGIKGDNWLLYTKNPSIYQRYPAVKPLETLENGYGYWVQYNDSNHATAVTESYKINIKNKGYALISLGLQQETKIQKLISATTVSTGQPAHISEVWLWGKNGNWLFYSGHADHTAKTLYPPIETIKPGQAVWVKTTVDNLTINTPNAVNTATVEGGANSISAPLLSGIRLSPFPTLHNSNTYPLTTESGWNCEFEGDTAPQFNLHYTIAPENNATIAQVQIYHRSPANGESLIYTDHESNIKTNGYVTIQPAEKGLHYYTITALLSNQKTISDTRLFYVNPIPLTTYGRILASLNTTTSYATNDIASTKADPLLRHTINKVRVTVTQTVTQNGTPTLISTPTEFNGLPDKGTVAVKAGKDVLFRVEFIDKSNDVVRTGEKRVAEVHLNPAQNSPIKVEKVTVASAPEITSELTTPSGYFATDNGNPLTISIGGNNISSLTYTTSPVTLENFDLKNLPENHRLNIHTIANKTFSLNITESTTLYAYATGSDGQKSGVHKYEYFRSQRPILEIAQYPHSNQVEVTFSVSYNEENALIPEQTEIFLSVNDGAFASIGTIKAQQTIRKTYSADTKIAAYAKSSHQLEGSIEERFINMPTPTDLQINAAIASVKEKTYAGIDGAYQIAKDIKDESGISEESRRQALLIHAITAVGKFFTSAEDSDSSLSAMLDKIGFNEAGRNVFDFSAKIMRGSNNELLLGDLTGIADIQSYLTSENESGLMAALQESIGSLDTLIESAKNEPSNQEIIKIDWFGDDISFHKKDLFLLRSAMHGLDFAIHFVSAHIFDIQDEAITSLAGTVSNGTVSNFKTAIERYSSNLPPAYEIDRIESIPLVQILKADSDFLKLRENGQNMLNRAKSSLTSYLSDLLEFADIVEYVHDNPPSATGIDTNGAFYIDDDEDYQKIGMSKRMALAAWNNLNKQYHEKIGIRFSGSVIAGKFWYERLNNEGSYLHVKSSAITDANTIFYNWLYIYHEQEMYAPPMTPTPSIYTHELIQANLGELFSGSLRSRLLGDIYINSIASDKDLEKAILTADNYKPITSVLALFPDSFLFEEDFQLSQTIIMETMSGTAMPPETRLISFNNRFSDEWDGVQNIWLISGPGNIRNIKKPELSSGYHKLEIPFVYIVLEMQNKSGEYEYYVKYSFSSDPHDWQPTFAPEFIEYVRDQRFPLPAVSTLLTLTTASPDVSGKILLETNEPARKAQVTLNYLTNYLAPLPQGLVTYTNNYGLYDFFGVQPNMPFYITVFPKIDTNDYYNYPIAYYNTESGGSTSHTSYSTSIFTNEAVELENMTLPTLGINHLVQITITDSEGNNIEMYNELTILLDVILSEPDNTIMSIDIDNPEAYFFALPAGNYYFRVHTNSSDYQDQYYSENDEITVVNIPTDTETPLELTFKLEKAVFGSIFGTISFNGSPAELENAEIKVCPSDDHSRYCFGNIIYESNNYRVSGIPVGTYYVQAFPNLAGYPAVYYTESGTTIYADEAKKFVIEADASTNDHQNINFNLLLGLNLQVNITDIGSEELNFIHNAELTVISINDNKSTTIEIGGWHFDNDNNNTPWGVLSGGQTQIALPAGEYYFQLAINTINPQLHYLPLYYNGETGTATANNKQIFNLQNAGQEISFILQKDEGGSQQPPQPTGTSISGNIYCYNVEGSCKKESISATIWLYSHDSNNPMAYSTNIEVSDINESYTFNGVPAGDYYLRISPYTKYAMAYYQSGNEQSPVYASLATTVTTDQSPLSNINFILSEGTSLTVVVEPPTSEEWATQSIQSIQLSFSNREKTEHSTIEIGGLNMTQGGTPSNPNDPPSNPNDPSGGTPGNPNDPPSNPNDPSGGTPGNPNDPPSNPNDPSGGTQGGSSSMGEPWGVLTGQPETIWLPHSVYYISLITESSNPQSSYATLYYSSGTSEGTTDKSQAQLFNHLETKTISFTLQKDEGGSQQPQPPQPPTGMGKILSGTIIGDNTLVSGAFVQLFNAEQFNQNDLPPLPVQITRTDENGQYGFEQDSIDTTKQYYLSVLTPEFVGGYYNIASSTISLVNTTGSASTISLNNSEPTTIDITLTESDSIAVSGTILWGNSGNTEPIEPNFADTWLFIHVYLNSNGSPGQFLYSYPVGAFLTTEKYGALDDTGSYEMLLPAGSQAYWLTCEIDSQELVANNAQTATPQSHTQVNFTMSEKEHITALVDTVFDSNSDDSLVRHQQSIALQDKIIVTWLGFDDEPSIHLYAAVYKLLYENSSGQVTLKLIENSKTKISNNDHPIKITVEELLQKSSPPYAITTISYTHDGEKYGFTVAWESNANNAERIYMETIIINNSIEHPIDRMGITTVNYTENAPARKPSFFRRADGTIYLFWLEEANNQLLYRNATIMFKDSSAPELDHLATLFNLEKEPDSIQFVGLQPTNQPSNLLHSYLYTVSDPPSLISSLYLGLLTTAHPTGEHQLLSSMVTDFTVSTHHQSSPTEAEILWTELVASSSAEIEARTSYIPVFLKHARVQMEGSSNIKLTTYNEHIQSFNQDIDSLRLQNPTISAFKSKNSSGQEFHAWVGNPYSQNNYDNFSIGDSIGDSNGLLIAGGYEKIGIFVGGLADFQSKKPSKEKVHILDKLSMNQSGQTSQFNLYNIQTTVWTNGTKALIALNALDNNNGSIVLGINDLPAALSALNNSGGGQGGSQNTLQVDFAIELEENSYIPDLTAAERNGNNWRIIVIDEPNSKIIAADWPANGGPFSLEESADTLNIQIITDKSTNPAGLCLYNNELFVASTSEIQKFTINNYGIISETPDNIDILKGGKDLLYPRAVYLTDKLLAVADTGNNRVLLNIMTNGSLSLHIIGQQDDSSSIYLGANYELSEPSELLIVGNSLYVTGQDGIKEFEIDKIAPKAKDIFNVDQTDILYNSTDKGGNAIIANLTNAYGYQRYPIVKTIALPQGEKTIISWLSSPVSLSTIVKNENLGYYDEIVYAIVNNAQNFPAKAPFKAVNSTGLIDNYDIVLPVFNSRVYPFFVYTEEYRTIVIEEIRGLSR